MYSWTSTKRQNLDVALEYCATCSHCCRLVCLMCRWPRLSSCIAHVAKIFTTRNQHATHRSTALTLAHPSRICFSRCIHPTCRQSRPNVTSPRFSVSRYTTLQSSIDGRIEHVKSSKRNSKKNRRKKRTSSSDCLLVFLLHLSLQQQQLRSSDRSWWPEERRKKERRHQETRTQRSIPPTHLLCHILYALKACHYITMFSNVEWMTASPKLSFFH